MTVLAARAGQAQERIQTATATASAPDGAASVTVGPGGALVNLTFGARAYRRPPEALAALVLSLTAQAQRQVGGQVAAAFAGMVGEDSAAMDMLRRFLPDEPDADEQQQQQQQQDRPAAPPPPAAPRPHRPAAGPRRPSGGEADDDDFSDPW